MKSNKQYYKGSKKSRVVDLVPTDAKVPPHSNDLEQVILGAVMVDKSAMDKIDGLLVAKHFYKREHQVIFTAILELYEGRFPIDQLTVFEKIKKRGELKDCGGIAYIAELTNRVASAANIEYHARIIQQYYVSRSIIDICQKNMSEAYADTGDVFDMLDEFEQGVMSIQDSLFSTEVKQVSSIAAERLKEIEQARKGEKKAGLYTYLSDLDDLLGGFQGGDFICLAARPGMGKTAFLVEVAKRQAKHDKPVGIFSLEMTDKQIVDRFTSNESRIVGTQLRTGELDDVEFQELFKATEVVADLPIFIDDTPALHINELRAKARRLKAFHKVEAIYIDYLQLLQADGFNREQEIANISMSLKALAKELDIPIIALAQLSREVEKRGGTKRPILSDLRSSGQIEQDCDVVGFIYRAERYEIVEYEDGTPTKDTAEIIIAKHRHGQLKDIRFKFKGAFSSFDDMENPDFEEDLDLSPAMPDNTIITRPSKFNDDEDIPF
jgi:replicative DNA helicase